MDKFFINGMEASDTHLCIRELQLGLGLFETIRIKEGCLQFWDEHLNRLKNSSSVLGMQEGLNADAIKEVTQNVVSQYGTDWGAMKMTWIPSKNGTVIHSFRGNPYTDEKKKIGMDICLGSLKRNPDSYTVFHKTTNYLDNFIQKKAVLAKGFDEAVLLNSKGFITECTSANIFFVSKGVIHTPHVQCGLLAGIMRKYVISTLASKKIMVQEGCYEVDVLKNAESIFLTNALMGVMPVSKFDGNCYDVNMKIVNAVGL